MRQRWMAWGVRGLASLILAASFSLIGHGMELTASTSTSTVAFAPYVDMTLPPVGNLATLASQAGIRSATLAFIVAAGTSCKPSWGNYFQVGTNSGQFLNEINAFKAVGGQPIISFGGEINNELASVCGSVSALESAYQEVVDHYHVYSLDFDIEGTQLNNTATVQLRNRALSLLQAKEASLGHQITISYTLPVLPTGLLANSLYLLKSAVTSGVKVSVVNVMAMDYGQANAPNPSYMGTYAIDAAEATQAQLASVYPALSSNQRWAMIGITPMIGQNDLAGEIFTTANASQVAQFAAAHSIGRLSYWELHRDTACVNNADENSNYCSGTTQTPYQFASIFGAVPTGPGSSPTPPPSSTSGGGGSTSSAGSVTLALSTSSSWYNGCNMAATVKNTGTTAVSAWSVGLALGSGDSIVNIWNAQLTTTTAGANASNVSYNGSLAPGASTSFGFQVAGDCSTVLPTGPGSSPTPPPSSTSGGGSSTSTSQFALTTVTTSQWDGGYTAEATVKNTGTTAVSAWSVGLALGSGDSIVNIWNAQLTTTTAGANASNVSYNGSLAPGASTSFGFQVAGPSAP